MAEEIGRRQFLSRMSLALLGMAGGGRVLHRRHLLQSVARTPGAGRIDLGKVDDYAVGKPSRLLRRPSPLPSGRAERPKTAVYVRRVAAKRPTIFAVNCTHRAAR